MVDEVDKKVKESIIKVYWEKNRDKMMMRDDLRRFLNNKYHAKIPSNASKASIVDEAKKYLTPDTLFDFCDGVYRFGLCKGDIKSILGVGDKTVQKLIDNDKIRFIGKHVNTNGIRVEYHMYSIKDIVQCYAPCNKKKHEETASAPLEPTDRNLAEALYIINKSAKVSRDTKNANYAERNFDVCNAAKTRMLNHYHLKDAVIKKLMSEGRMKYVGINRQVLPDDDENYLALYEIAGLYFHVPCDNQETPNKGEILNDIDGLIASEKKIPISLKYRQAVALLESYSGEKISGIFNKERDEYRPRRHSYRPYYSGSWLDDDDDDDELDDEYEEY